MKQILYIPSGRYVTFPEGTAVGDRHRFSAEEMITYYEGSTEDGTQYFHSCEGLIIGLCACQSFWNRSVYASAEIEIDKPLLECEFEVVDV